MGDEFNGSVKKAYLGATLHNKCEPLSQENVRLTSDHAQCFPKAVSALPLIMNPAQTGEVAAMKVLRGLLSITQTIISKDRKYQKSFIVRKIQLITGSYFHKGQKQAEKCESIEQFIQRTVSTFVK